MNSIAVTIISLLLLVELQSVRTVAIDVSTGRSTTSSGSTNPATPTPFPDPELLQYLKQLYKGVKKLERPLINGELNLLPEKTSGFANAVRCFSDIGGASVMDDSRTLQFNVSSLSTLNEIIAIDLVLKQAPNIPSYKTQLHEIIESEEGESDLDLKLLDEGEHAGGEWHTIHVRDVVDSVDLASGWRNYRLVLSVSGDGDFQVNDILHSIKPMLLVYTNDANGTSVEIGPRPGTATPTQGRFVATPLTKGSRDDQTIRSKRSAATQTQLPALQSLGGQHCQRVVRTMTFEQLGWPGSQYAVIQPSLASFSFCYGLCNRANDYQYRSDYTNHARLLALSHQELVDEGIAPGCAPVGYVPTEVTYISTFSNVITMTTLPGVTSCKCL